MKITLLEILGIAVMMGALLLTGCAHSVGSSADDISKDPTVQDIFHETIEPTANTNSTETTTEPSFNIGMALATEFQQDQKGSYLVYEGGEMNVSFEIKTSGNIAQKGIGVLLFIDGQPQPYKTDENPEYAYLQIFYPTTGQNIYNFSFIPVTGTQGDDLEIYTASVLYPTYSKTEGYVGMVYTSGSVILGFRLKYEQAPPADSYPEKQPWLSETTVSFIDTTASEIRGWSDDDLRERIAYNFYINETDDMNKREVYDVSADEYVSVRYEIWGSPYVNYGLVFFVDNVPVRGTDVENLMIEVKNGQKTVVEAKLDLKQFDGESVVYAILVPRNYRSSEVETAAYLTCTNAIFLLEAKAQ